MVAQYEALYTAAPGVVAGSASRADSSAVAHYEAVVFDFDGTLIDSYPAITASVNFVRQERGMGPLPVDEVKKHVGRGPHHLLAHTVPGYQADIDVPRYRAHHPSVMRELTALMPGATDVLAALRADGK